MKLYLDDIRPCPHGWIPARTPADFRRLVLDHDWDEMSLDHDLSDEHYYGFTAEEKRERPEDGYDLTRWLFRSGRLPKQKPVVHSANPDGARRMRNYIDGAWDQKDFTDPDYGL